MFPLLHFFPTSVLFFFLLFGVLLKCASQGFLCHQGAPSEAAGYPQSPPASSASFVTQTCFPAQNSRGQQVRVRFWEFEGEDLGGTLTKINILGFIFNFQGVMLTQEHSGTTIHQQQGDFPFKHHNFSQWPMFFIGNTIDFHPRCLCVDARQKRCLPGLGIGCLGSGRKYRPNMQRHFHPHQKKASNLSK